MERLRRILYVLWQCTWGFVQTLAGACVFLYCLAKGYPVSRYRGAVLVRWQKKSSMSLGLFIFVARKVNPWKVEIVPTGESEAEVELDYLEPEVAEQTIIRHEYGHTIQSLIFGPLYLIVIGIPSFIWANIPRIQRRWRPGGLRAYFGFWTERWATALGERFGS